MISNPPIGLWFGKNHIKIMKSTFEDTDSRNYLKNEIKRDPNNDKHIFVISENKKQSVCYEINENLNELVSIQNNKLCKKMDRLWQNFLTNKSKMQQSNLSVNDKEKFVKLSRQKHLNQIKLSDKNNTELESKLKKL